MKTSQMRASIFVLTAIVLALIISAKFAPASVSTTLEYLSVPFVIIELILFMILYSKGFTDESRKCN